MQSKITRLVRSAKVAISAPTILAKLVRRQTILFILDHPSNTSYARKQVVLERFVGFVNGTKIIEEVLTNLLVVCAP
jgi:hypothetical protein